MNVTNRLIIIVAGCAGVLSSCEAEKPEKTAGASAQASAPTPAPSAPPKAPEPTLEQLNAFKPPTAKGKVFFKGLKDGSKLGGKAFMGAVPVKLEFAAEGMTVEPSGAVHENAGHFAVGIDAEPLALGTAIKKGSSYQAYEKGETEVQVGVKPGDHKLTLQLVDARNRSYGPEWAQTIKIKVAEKK
jgi:Domain of unknown function (DUF4399)